MRIRKCSYHYLGDDKNVFPQIQKGGVITTQANPMRASLLGWDGGRYETVDLLANVEIVDRPDGSYILSGVSALAEGEFGVEQSRVNVLVTPDPGCRGCGK